jgi:hypothetical protein
MIKEAKEKLEEVFTPKDVCSICNTQYNEEEGGIQGHFGIMPVTFCVWCYSSIVDMVSQDIDICDHSDDT